MRNWRGLGWSGDLDAASGEILSNPSVPFGRVGMIKLSSFGDFGKMPR